MRNALRMVDGLDHKCIKCGNALLAHDYVELTCPDETGNVYSPKGPQISPKLRHLMQVFEDVALDLHQTVVDEAEREVNPYQVLPEGYKSPLTLAKNAYKEARFVLLDHLQDICK